MSIKVQFSYEGKVLSGYLSSAKDAWNLIIDGSFWARLSRDQYGWLIKPAYGRRLWNEAKFFGTIIESNTPWK